MQKSLPRWTDQKLIHVLVSLQHCHENWIKVSGKEGRGRWWTAISLSPSLSWQSYLMFCIFKILNCREIFFFQLCYSYLSWWTEHWMISSPFFKPIARIMPVTCGPKKSTKTNQRVRNTLSSIFKLWEGPLECDSFWTKTTLDSSDQEVRCLTWFSSVSLFPTFFIFHFTHL